MTDDGRPILDSHWHKVVVLLMDEFDLSEFRITTSSIQALKDKEPVLATEVVGNEIVVRLMSKAEAKRLVQ